MSWFELFFWGTAVLATLLLMVKWLFGDFLADATEIAESDALSLNALLVAAKAMGWIGVVCLKVTHFSPVAIAAVAVASGGLTFGLATLLLRRLKRLEADGTLDPSRAIGAIGTVYLGIPAAGESGGQVQVPVQGRLATLDAKTTGPAIPTGEKVLIFAVEGSTLLVVPEKELNLLSTRENGA